MYGRPKKSAVVRMADPAHSGGMETRITEQVSFMTARLPATPARILDAGCGRGELARALTDRGYDVTAIDLSPDAVAEARKAGVDAKVANIEDYQDDPFDAVLFSVSLHHVERLDRALARTRELLKPGGVVIADEFAWERATPATAAWFYDMAVVLGKAGLIDRDDEVLDDPLRRWWQRHRDDDPMHPGEAMISVFRAHLDVVETKHVPYLHRYLDGWLTEPDNRVFAALRDIEQRRVADGSLAKVGLQLVARRPAHSPAGTPAAR
jgi:SAM-dependent methyltransferase